MPLQSPITPQGTQMMQSTGVLGNLYQERLLKEREMNQRAAMEGARLNQADRHHGAQMDLRREENAEAARQFADTLGLNEMMWLDEVDARDAELLRQEEKRLYQLRLDQARAAQETVIGRTRPHNKESQRRWIDLMKSSQTGNAWGAAGRHMINLIADSGLDEAQQTQLYSLVSQIVGGNMQPDGGDQTQSVRQQMIGQTPGLYLQLMGFSPSHIAAINNASGSILHDPNATKALMQDLASSMSGHGRGSAPIQFGMATMQANNPGGRYAPPITEAGLRLLDVNPGIPLSGLGADALLGISETMGDPGPMPSVGNGAAGAQHFDQIMRAIEDGTLDELMETWLETGGTGKTFNITQPSTWGSGDDTRDVPRGWITTKKPRWQQLRDDLITQGGPNKYWHQLATDSGDGTGAAKQFAQSLIFNYGQTSPKALTPDERTFIENVSTELFQGLAYSLHDSSDGVSGASAQGIKEYETFLQAITKEDSPNSHLAQLVLGRFHALSKMMEANFATEEGGFSAMWSLRDVDGGDTKDPSAYRLAILAQLGDPDDWDSPEEMNKAFRAIDRRQERLLAEADVKVSRNWGQAARCVEGYALTQQKVTDMNNASAGLSILMNMNMDAIKNNPTPDNIRYQIGEGVGIHRDELLRVAIESNWPADKIEVFEKYFKDLDGDMIVDKAFYLHEIMIAGGKPALPEDDAALHNPLVMHFVNALQPVITLSKNYTAHQEYVDWSIEDREADMEFESDRLKDYDDASRNVLDIIQAEIDRSSGGTNP